MRIFNFIARIFNRNSTHMKYPTEWRIKNTFDPGYWNSKWERYGLKHTPSGSVTIEWEREIAPYHVEIRMTQEKVTPPTL